MSPKPGSAPTLLGALLLVTVTATIIRPPLSERLESLYQNPTWRLATGLTLALLILWQWSLGYSRSRAHPALPRRLAWHRWIGAVAPLLLVAHVISLASGYLAALTITFLANCALGLLTPHKTQRHSMGWRALWLPLHITASIALTALMLIHIIVVANFH